MRAHARGGVGGGSGLQTFDRHLAADFMFSPSVRVRVRSSVCPSVRPSSHLAKASLASVWLHFGTQCRLGCSLVRSQGPRPKQKREGERMGGRGRCSLRRAARRSGRQGDFNFSFSETEAINRRPNDSRNFPLRMESDQIPACPLFTQSSLCLADRPSVLPSVHPSASVRLICFSFDRQGEGGRGRGGGNNQLSPRPSEAAFSSSFFAAFNAALMIVVHFIDYSASVRRRPSVRRFSQSDSQSVSQSKRLITNSRINA